MTANCLSELRLNSTASLFDEDVFSLKPVELSSVFNASATDATSSDDVASMDATASSDAALISGTATDDATTSDDAVESTSTDVQGNPREEDGCIEFMELLTKLQCEKIQSGIKNKMLP